MVKKSTSPVPEFKLQMCPTGSISTTNVQQRQQYAVSTSLLNLRNQLSLVSALEQLHPGLGYILKSSLDHSLSALKIELAFLECILEYLKSLRELLHVVQHDEALDIQAHDHDFEPILDSSCALLRLIVLADGTTCSNTTAMSETCQDQIKDFSANVILKQRSAYTVSRA